MPINLKKMLTTLHIKTISIGCYVKNMRPQLLMHGAGPNFIEVLIREFCLANIFAKHFKTDYQPKYINFTCKFGW